MKLEMHGNLWERMEIHGNLMDFKAFASRKANFGSPGGGELLGGAHLSLRDLHAGLRAPGKPLEEAKA